MNIGDIVPSTMDRLPKTSSQPFDPGRPNPPTSSVFHCPVFFPLWGPWFNLKSRGARPKLGFHGKPGRSLRNSGLSPIFFREARKLDPHPISSPLLFRPIFFCFGGGGVSPSSFGRVKNAPFRSFDFFRAVLFGFCWVALFWCSAWWAPRSLGGGARSPAPFVGASFFGRASKRALELRRGPGLEHRGRGAPRGGFVSVSFGQVSGPRSELPWWSLGNLLAYVCLILLIVMLFLFFGFWLFVVLVLLIVV